MKLPQLIQTWSSTSLPLSHGLLTVSMLQYSLSLLLFSLIAPHSQCRPCGCAAVMVAFSSSGVSNGYPGYQTAGMSSPGVTYGDSQAKARPCSGGWQCPWTCYQILIRKESTYTVEDLEDLTGQETCFDTCVWALVRACTHSHAHCFSLATVHLCRTVRVTTADQAPNTVCAVGVLTARTVGDVRQRHHQHHCCHPHPRRHHLLCHRVRL